MNNTVNILGAPSLMRFTRHLEKGFVTNGWSIDASSKNVLLQIHGSPSTETDDKNLLQNIVNFSSDSKYNLLVLVHRPDEIKDRHPEFKHILAGIQSPIVLCFLGDFFVNDPFYIHKNVTNAVVPHGFFDFEPRLQKAPIVMGTHTTWGEMRSTDHLLKLLGHIFRQHLEYVVGYLGGTPENMLDVSKLQRQFHDEFPDLSINFALFDNEISAESKNIIFVNPTKAEPANLGVTFNTQMYYYGNKIRTGESSGSAHTMLSIPVVLEMNGSERLENLKVVKIPYKNVDDINSVDIANGAKQIVEIIRSKQYVPMLEHNFEQIKIYNSSYVAKKYIDLFSTLTHHS